MYIKEIALNNFRIYKKSHSIYFNPDGEKNVFIISGNNGYGKTTFLTSLVWCLYGKFMRDVDDIFKVQIGEAGGYTNFVQSCLNRMALKEKENEFSVSITFTDIDVPAITCNEIKIIRTGYYKRGVDKLEILIDNEENELTKEVGNDIFIQDFILPKEVAKFFFFDSEKIVSLAESKSITSKRQLSKAYSEILGIKKYEDLKKNLQDLTIRFRKTSASPKDKEKFKKLKKETESFESEIVDFKIEIDRLDEENLLLKKESDDLQEKLIREGSGMSVDEINNLKIEKYQVSSSIEKLKIEFRDILDLAPFAIIGKLLSEVKEQLEVEKAVGDSNTNQEVLNKKGEKLLRALKRFKADKQLKVDPEIDKHYKEALEKLIRKTIIIKSDKVSSKTQTLHSFSEGEYNQFNALYLQLKSSYANRVRQIAKDLRNNRLAYAKVTRKLSDAESKESDGVIAKYREQKVAKDTQIQENEQLLMQLHQNIGATQIEIISRKKVTEELAKKIKINKRYKEKDILTQRLIKELDEFIIKIKSDKKKALEKRILASLNILMHKKSFIKRVNVSVGEDIIDITLLNSRKEEINKDTLSKGEQQLYATAILKALVEESNIDFPVFIDSPLQKFDAKHAKNIISDFYPTISKQVVLFPLLKKEMTEEEYDLLADKVKGAYIIQNEHEDLSSFVSVNPFNLFKAAKKLQAHVF